MSRVFWGCLTILVVLGVVSCKQVSSTPKDATDPPTASPSASDVTVASVTFAKDIGPIFNASCNNCHGGRSTKGNFSVNSYAEVMKGGKSGAVIVPGNPDGSKLFRLVTKQEEPYMPKKGDPLTSEQIETLRKWILAGAPEG